MWKAITRSVKPVEADGAFEIIFAVELDGAEKAIRTIRVKSQEEAQIEMARIGAEIKAVHEEQKKFPETLEIDL